MQGAVPGDQQEHGATAKESTEAVVGGKRRNDEAAVMGAKERYLARKKQMAGGS